MKTWEIIGASLVLGFIAGYNLGERDGYPENIWPMDRSGLDELNRGLKNDKSDRLGLAIITQKGTYSVQAIDQERYKLRAAFFERQ